MNDDIFKLRCRICNQPVRWPPEQPRCPRPSCRGPLQPIRTVQFDPSLIEPSESGMWRYRHMLPIERADINTMGEGWTPLLTGRFEDTRVSFKNETLQPTGSFKDRGAALLINIAKDDRAVMDDSSGNAGAALAAYAARAGLRARIFAPASAPTSKKAQIARYGAELIEVPGNRDAVTAAAEAAADEGFFYASHIWHPAYVLAMQTIAWEIWEQMGGRAPNWIVLPAGNGTLLRGIRWGFRSLQKGKRIKNLPRFVAVQAAYCAPLLARSLDEYTPGEYRATPTIADGVAIPNPPLIEAMWSAIRKTKGAVIAVSEEDITAARVALMQQGLFVEPTAALPYAALTQLKPHLSRDDSVVLILTGHGFKSD